MDRKFFVPMVRRCIYSRWFYAFLAAVCLLNALAELLDLLYPGDNPTLDVVTLALSAVSGIVALVVFLDLQLRWPRR